MAATIDTIEIAVVSLLPFVADSDIKHSSVEGIAFLEGVHGKQEGHTSILVVSL